MAETPAPNRKWAFSVSANGLDFSSAAIILVITDLSMAERWYFSHTLGDCWRKILAPY